MEMKVSLNDRMRFLADNFRYYMTFSVLGIGYNISTTDQMFKSGTWLTSPVGPEYDAALTAVIFFSIGFLFMFFDYFYLIVVFRRLATDKPMKEPKLRSIFGVSTSTLLVGKVAFIAGSVLTLIQFCVAHNVKGWQIYSPVALVVVMAAVVAGIWALLTSKRAQEGSLE